MDLPPSPDNPQTNNSPSNSVSSTASKDSASGSQNTKSVVIFGSTDGAGLDILYRFYENGWTCHCLTRDVENAKKWVNTIYPQIDLSDKSSKICFTKCDATDKQSVITIITKINPIGVIHAMYYKPIILPVEDIKSDIMTGNLISACQSIKCPLLYVSNLYSLGNKNFRSHGSITEETPKEPITSFGSFGNLIEDQLQKAAMAKQDAIQVILLRCADIFGPSVRNPMVDKLFLKALLKKTMFVYGKKVNQHQFTFSKDLARVAESLFNLHYSDKAKAIRTEKYMMVNIPSHVVPTLELFAKKIAKSAGLENPNIKEFSWSFMNVRAAFSKQAKVLKDNKYLWDSPHIISSVRIHETLPGFKPNPIDDAINITLDSYRQQYKSQISQQKRRKTKSSQAQTI